MSHARVLSCLLFPLALAAPAAAQATNQWGLASMLGFEYGIPGAAPFGWTASSDGSMLTDCQVAHSGSCSGRATRTAFTSASLSGVQTSLTIPAGRTLRWSGFIRTSGVNGAAVIYMGEADAASNNLQFATTQGLNVQGTHDWTSYSITAPVDSRATQLYFGFFLSGTGTAWVDDLQLTVDGQPVAPVPPAGFTADTQFAAGSGIAIDALSDTQVANLAVLANVWGFLKYYHPVLTAGQRNWDYDLFRILPTVLAAADNPTANQAISDWIDATLGPVPTCGPCATLDTSDLYLGTNLDWIADASLLGPDLSQTLQSVFANRTPQPQTFFVAPTPGAPNPWFLFESSYPRVTLPDSGYQLLALFRAWNMLQYFNPNRLVMSDDPTNASYWDNALVQFIPALATAPSSLTYQQAMLRFTALINDTHSGITNLGGRPPLGACQLPVLVRFAEGVPVVAGFLAGVAPNTGMQMGDVIQQLDGVAVSDLIAQWTPYYTDSNQAARLRDIAAAMTQGACGPASVSVLRGQETVDLTPSRVPIGSLNLSPNYVADRPGAAFQMLSPDIAYLKLSAVDTTQSANYIQSAAGTKGFVIDIRNYPATFVVFTLGDLLTPQPVNFVQFTQGDFTTPGAFHWGPPIGLTPAQPQYAGKVVVLVDEITQSQAEYTSMAFRAAGATIIGSTTAGADGNVSAVPLPGGFYFYFSGLGVYYPDHTPTQRVGIVPDVLVTPTIAGIQAGRDEVLDAAMQLIEGNSARKPVTRRR